MLDQRQKQVLKWTGWSMLAVFGLVFLYALWFVFNQQVPPAWMWLFSGVYWLTYLGAMAILASAAALWQERMKIWQLLMWLVIGVAIGVVWQLIINVLEYYLLGVLVYHVSTGWWAGALSMLESAELYVSGLTVFFLVRGVMHVLKTPAIPVVSKPKPVATSSTPVVK
jgi:membrane protease YdiL (CAAX protease family)